MSVEYGKLIPALAAGIKFVAKENSEYAYIYLTDGTVKIVNRTALEILKLCDGKRSIKDIAEVIARKYRLEFSIAVEEVTKFLHEAAKLRVVKFYEK